MFSRGSFKMHPDVQLVVNCHFGVGCPSHPAVDMEVEDFHEVGQEVTSVTACAWASELVVLKSTADLARARVVSQGLGPSESGFRLAALPIQYFSSVSEKDPGGVPSFPRLSHRSSWKGAEAPLTPGGAG